MTICTDKASGTLTCVVGIGMVTFALFGLVIIALQRAMLAAMPPLPANDGGVSVMDAMHAIHGVWVVYLPLMILGGVVFAVAGYYVMRGSWAARRVAQLNALCGYAWGIGYSISCYQIMDVLAPESPLPHAVLSGFKAASMISGTLLLAALPTGMLYILCRPAEPPAKTRVESAERA